MLPDAHRRSLAAYGWADGEIESAMKSDPANFAVVAAKLHKARGEELAKWAEIGRQNRTQAQSQQRQASAQPAAKPGVASNANAEGGLVPIDVDAMVEQYGNSEFIRGVADPVNRAIAQINELLPVVKAHAAESQQARQADIGARVDKFFQRPDLAPFGAHYGESAAKMSAEQAGARNKVLEMADALISGALLQGRRLDIDEALTLAHDSVSAGVKVEAARREAKEEVKAEVRKRSAATTLRPGMKTGSDTGRPRTEAELERRTRDRLAAVFGG